MKNPFLLFIALLLAGGATAQIHTGGFGDGFSGKAFAQQTDTALFTGGFGDGFSRENFAQPTQAVLFTGGDGDGFSRESFAQPTQTVLFTGGEGDGFSRESYAQNTQGVFFTGGEGDGFSRQNYAQPTDTVFFTGGEGDGYARNGYTQRTDTVLFTGGIGDGYSFTAIPLVPLPVNWLAFTGRRVGTTHQLEWKVAATRPGERFQLERSPTGAQYSPLHSQIVEGTSAGKTVFGYTDAEPLQGDNFYRVRQTDIAGRASYSSTVLLRNLSNNRSLVLFPNPAATQIRLRVEGSLSNAPLEARVYNAAGQVLAQFRLEAGAPHYDLDISGWAAGNYFLQVVDGGKPSIIPFVKAGQ